MIISYAKDNRERVCACCGKAIIKGDLYINDIEVIDGWNNTRKFFAHTQCFIDKLIALKEKAEKQVEDIKKASKKKIDKQVDKISFEITRHVGKFYPGANKVIK